MDKNGKPITSNTLMSELPDEMLGNIASILAEVMKDDPRVLLKLGKALNVIEDNEEDKLVQFHGYNVLPNGATLAEQKKCIEVLTAYETYVKETNDTNLSIGLIAYLSTLADEKAICRVVWAARNIVTNHTNSMESDKA